jgi:hypothetical protein
MDLSPAVLSIWRPRVTIHFKNIGRSTWYQDQIVLKTWSKEGINPFKDESWPNDQGNFNLKESMVRPGEEGSFSFYLNPPEIFKVHRHIYQMYHLRLGDFIPGSLHHQLTRVDPSF